MSKQGTIAADIAAHRLRTNPTAGSRRDKVLALLEGDSRMWEAWENLFAKADPYMERPRSVDTLLSAIANFKNVADNVNQAEFLRQHLVSKKEDLLEAVETIRSFYSEETEKGVDPISQLGLLKTRRQPTPELFLRRVQMDVTETYESWTAYVQAAFPLSQKQEPHIAFTINLADVVDMILGPSVKARVPAVLTEFIATTVNVVFQTGEDRQFTSDSVRHALKGESKRRRAVHQ